MKISKGVVLVVLMLGVAAYERTTVAEEIEGTEQEMRSLALEAEPLPAPAPGEIPPTADDGPPDAVDQSCSTSVQCDDGSWVSCSCGGGGTCTAKPNGPWGGSVSCDCGGGPVCYHCNESTCQESCDQQCGGAGYGECMNNICYCY